MHTSMQQPPHGHAGPLPCLSPTVMMSVPAQEHQYTLSCPALRVGTAASAGVRTRVALGRMWTPRSV